MEWREIAGYPGYSVSNTGLVRGKRGWVLRPDINQGYHLVSLAPAPWKKKTLRIHRIVALAFIVNPDNLPEVDHIDRNRANNEVSNLRWVDRRTNGHNQTPRLTKAELISEVIELRDLGLSERQIQRRLRDTPSWLRLRKDSGVIFRRRLRQSRLETQKRAA